MNERTQITLDPDMRRRARAKARELGMSFAGYIRRLVEGDLGDARPKTDISAVFDLIDEGPRTDIARDKDKMIGAAVWDDYLRSVGRRPRKSDGKPRGR